MTNDTPDLPSILDWARDNLDLQPPTESREIAGDGRWIIMAEGDASPGIVWSELFPKNH